MEYVRNQAIASKNQNGRHKPYKKRIIRKISLEYILMYIYNRIIENEIY